MQKQCNVCSSPETPSSFRQWLDHPERVRLRNALFQIHLWIGSAIGFYVLMMSVTGSIIVFRNELSRCISVEWLVKLHTALLAGRTGQFLNGIAAGLLTIVCITGMTVWWPGIKNWQRGLTINWRSRFARLNWDAHSAFGFWSFGFVLLWAVSGVYFSFPDLFNSVSAWIDPRDRYADDLLSLLAQLHFGRFNRLTEFVWAFVGLIPALLAATGVFLCCHRILDSMRARGGHVKGLPASSHSTSTGRAAIRTRFIPNPH
jgi:uncharacterized iron-regulated membrane protein